MSDLKHRAWAVIQRMDGWADSTRVSTLIDLVLTHKPKRLVEIGIFGGRSLAAMGFACQYLGQGFVWGIDPWTKEAAIEGESEANVKWWSELDIESVYIKFIQNIIAMNLTRECRWIRATAVEAAPLFADNSIDLLSLDGNHSELASCREAIMWMPKMASMGVIVVDDIHWPSQEKMLQLIRQGGFRTIQEVRNDEASWAAFQKP